LDERSTSSTGEITIDPLPANRKYTKKALRSKCNDNQNKKEQNNQTDNAIFSQQRQQQQQQQPTKLLNIECDIKTQFN
jgi:hypothetical protein